MRFSGKKQNGRDMKRMFTICFMGVLILHSSAELMLAADRVAKMAGPYRVPDLIKLADAVARNEVCT